MPHPTDFRPPAYRALIKALGESDAAVEWIEVGVREIRRLSETDGGKAAKKLAAKHGVYVRPIDLDDLRTRCSRLQVLAVYQQTEYFLRAFTRTHPRQVEFSRDADEDPLSATLSAFKVTPEQVGILEVDLFQYYRVVRNLIMHDPQGDQPKTHQRRCENLRACVRNSLYGTLEAPNPVDKLCFDDFVLFTRFAKQLAANLCATTSPTDDELVACVWNSDLLMKKVRSRSNNRQRGENLIAGFLREKYSISDRRAVRIGQHVFDEAR